MDDDRNPGEPPRHAPRPAGLFAGTDVHTPAADSLTEPSHVDALAEEAQHLKPSVGSPDRAAPPAATQASPPSLTCADHHITTRPNCQAPSRLYPETLARRWRQQEIVDAPRTATKLKIIPPDRRRRVPGHSPLCGSCWRFVAAGGGCPGVTGQSPHGPVCLAADEQDELRLRRGRALAMCELEEAPK